MQEAIYAHNCTRLVTPLSAKTPSKPSSYIPADYAGTTQYLRRFDNPDKIFPINHLHPYLQSLLAFHQDRQGDSAFMSLYKDKDGIIYPDPKTVKHLSQREIEYRYGKYFFDLSLY